MDMIHDAQFEAILRASAYSVDTESTRTSEALAGLMQRLEMRVSDAKIVNPISPREKVSARHANAAMADAIRTLKAARANLNREADNIAAQLRAHADVIQQAHSDEHEQPDWQAYGDQFNACLDRLVPDIAPDVWRSVPSPF